MLSRRCVFSYYVRERAGELVYLARVGPMVSSCQTEEHIVLLSFRLTIASTTDFHGSPQPICK